MQEYYNTNYVRFSITGSLFTVFLSAPVFIPLVTKWGYSPLYAFVYGSGFGLMFWFWFMVIEPAKYNSNNVEYYEEEEEEEEEPAGGRVFDLVQTSENKYVVADLPAKITVPQMAQLADALTQGRRFSRAHIVNDMGIMTRQQLERLQLSMVRRGLADRLPNNQIALKEKGSNWIQQYKEIV